MTHILGIDCSGNAAALALITDGNVTVKVSTDLQQANAVFKLYDMLQIIGTLDAIGVTTGPGSFTGIRIGLAFAEGLALASNIPIYGLTSFRAAYRPADGYALVVLESKRKEVYSQFIYINDTDSGHAPFMACLKQLPTSDVIISNINLDDVPGIHTYTRRTASDMAVAAAQHAVRCMQQNVSPVSLLPTYVRPPDAKPNFPKTTGV